MCANNFLKKARKENKSKKEKTEEKRRKGTKLQNIQKLTLYISSYKGIECIYNLKTDKLYGIISKSHENKRRWIFILKRGVLFYGKVAFKVLCVLALAITIIIAIVLLKYKPAYKVFVDGEQVGLVENVQEFEKYFDGKMNLIKYIAFYSVEKEPKYEFAFVSKKEEFNKDAVYNKIAENTQITYSAYAITVDGEEEAYVGNVEEAEKLVGELSKKYAKNDEDLDINIGVHQVYTQNAEDYTIDKSSLAKKEVTKVVDKKLEEEHENKKHTVNGILLAQTPVSGVITSRYGSRWGTTHKGLDIGAPIGTDIHAAGDGTVEKVVNSNVGYGNLVVISHGNGIQTYYAHCSKLYVKKGQKISAGDVIAAVGSTGDSTGPHCHFEIRIDGVATNPQQYLYNN